MRPRQELVTSMRPRQEQQQLKEYRDDQQWTVRGVPAPPPDRRFKRRAMNRYDSL
eukprot:TRINITY_DN4782_c0_g1_i1.p4 TRINITY_DN4782_c0_g1~~TRINITY_DN4782_c0_g1_i1.p4  ORF type:complete len:55 (-),score=6.76 TRINITY_DN4782_c0_g1_i1:167-331(-)